MTSAGLEQRIASVLSGNGGDATSAELADLIASTEAAVVAAVRIAGEAQERALDPGVVVDVEAVAAEVAAAELRAGRLRAALPRLRARHGETVEAEALAAWRINATELQQRREALGAEFMGFYPDAIARIVDHLHRMRSIDAEINRFNAARPERAGVIEYITPFFAPELKIPDPDAAPDKAGPLPLLWPPAEPSLAAVMAANSKPDPFIGADWWKEIERRDAKMLEDNRRQIAEAEQRQAAYEERQAAEAKEADRKAYAERGWPQS